LKQSPRYENIPVDFAKKLEISPVLLFIRKTTTRNASNNPPISNIVFASVLPLDDFDFIRFT